MTSAPRARRQRPAGRCWFCSEPAEPNRTLCAAHREKGKEAQRSRRVARREETPCPTCQGRGRIADPAAALQVAKRELETYRQYIAALLEEGAYAALPDAVAELRRRHDRYLLVASSPSSPPFPPGSTSPH